MTTEDPALRGDGCNVILASGSYDHTIRFWHPATGMCLHTINHPDSQVNALEVTPDGCHLAAAGYQHIRMYDLTTDNPSPVINCENVGKNVTAVGFHADNRWMFTGGEDCSARIWDLRSRQLQCQRIFQVNTSVNCVCLHPNQTELFVGDASGTIHFWDLRTDHNEQLSPEPNASIQHLDLDTEGTMLAAVNNKGVCYVWSLVGGAGMRKLVPKIKVQVHNRYALKCRFSPDSTLLCTTSADQTARLWRTADFSEITVLQPNSKDQKWVWDCAFTADSQHVFTCSSDGLIRLWSIEGGEPLRQYVGHGRVVTALAFRDAPLTPKIS